MLGNPNVTTTTVDSGGSLGSYPSGVLNNFFDSTDINHARVETYPGRSDLPSIIEVRNRVSDNNALDPQVGSVPDDSTYDLSGWLQTYNEALAKQYEFNALEAQKDRDWQEMMSNTAYQRAMADMKKAGINPLVALAQLEPASTPSGSSASGSYASTAPYANALVSYLNNNKQLAGSLVASLAKILNGIIAFFS